MAEFDLIIKNGTVIDGSGRPGFNANVGIKDGLIVDIDPNLNGSTSETIDAEGYVVTPGFIDGHTHYDAQIHWDPLVTSSSYHGVTSVVMGNCGFSLAPCSEKDMKLVIENLQRAEDLPPEAMYAGIKWSWTNFREWMDTLEGLPKGINYASQVGHCALRTFVMGERAFTEQATENDVKLMESELEGAIKAGAIGFSTSRSPSHETPDGRFVASRIANWNEVTRLVRVMGNLKAGIFEIAGEAVGRSADDLEGLNEYLMRLQNLTVETGVPITWGLFSRRGADGVWQRHLEGLNETAAAGGKMFAQVHTRDLRVLTSFRTHLPWDNLPEWKELRALPLVEQEARLRDPEIRQKLIKIAKEPQRKAIGAEPRAGSYDWTFVMDTPEGPYRSVAEIAGERSCDPIEAMIEIAVEDHLNTFFAQPIANEDQDHALELLKAKHTAVTFSDAGAHVLGISDASLQTYMLSHWVRRIQAFTLEEAVRRLSYDNAKYWGFTDRGLLRPGMKADIVVFDPNTVGPEMPDVVNDFPTGAPRLIQKAKGFKATIVNGQTLYLDGKHTGALPGQLLRGPLARSNKASLIV
jgi:N-acyl-D-amino-acid deacylase